MQLSITIERLKKISLGCKNKINKPVVVTVNKEKMPPTKTSLKRRRTRAKHAWSSGKPKMWVHFVWEHTSVKRRKLKGKKHCFQRWYIVSTMHQKQSIKQITQVIGGLKYKTHLDLWDNCIKQVTFPVIKMIWLVSLLSCKSTKDI